MTLGVEKVPVGKNRLVRVPHDHHGPSLERANVLLCENGMYKCFHILHYLYMGDQLVVIIVFVDFIMSRPRPRQPMSMIKV